MLAGTMPHMAIVLGAAKVLAGIQEQLAGQVKFIFQRFFARVAREALGADKVVSLVRPTMAADDMAWFLQKVPGSYFFLSSRKAGGVFPHHHPKFDIDEEVLWVGTGLICEVVSRYLSGEVPGDIQG